jgi:hypothetical protein
VATATLELSVTLPDAARRRRLGYGHAPPHLTVRRKSDPLAHTAALGLLGPPDQRAMIHPPRQRPALPSPP